MHETIPKYNDCACPLYNISSSYGPDTYVHSSVPITMSTSVSLVNL